MLEVDLRQPIGSTTSKKTNIFTTDGSLVVHVQYIPTKSISGNTLRRLVLNQDKKLRRSSVGVTTLQKKTIFSTDEKFPSSVCWRKIPVSKWDSTVTMYWVMHALQKLKIRHEDIKLSNFSTDGSHLLNMSREDFISLEKQHGEVLYEELRKRISTDDNSPDTTNVQKKSDNVRKPRGRPLKNGSRKNKEKGGKMVWEFLIDLLKDNKHEKLITWKDQKRGIFKFECSGEVARIWGDRKQNKNMNFEKMSRAMRYHYKSKILMPVEGERLVYRFGPGLDLNTGKPVAIQTSGKDEDLSDMSDY